MVISSRIMQIFLISFALAVGCVCGDEASFTNAASSSYLAAQSSLLSVAASEPTEIFHTSTNTVPIPTGHPSGPWRRWNSVYFDYAQAVPPLVFINGMILAPGHGYGHFITLSGTANRELYPQWAENGTLRLDDPQEQLELRLLMEMTHLNGFYWLGMWSNGRPGPPQGTFDLTDDVKLSMRPLQFPLSIAAFQEFWGCNTNANFELLDDAVSARHLLLAASFQSESLAPTPPSACRSLGGFALMGYGENAYSAESLAASF